MNFQWISDSLGDQHFDRAMIYLPVSIDGLPHDFTFQFDLGLDVTLVYEQSIRPYLAEYPELGQKLDTASDLDFLRQVDIVIDGREFTDRSILLYDDDRNVLTADSVRSTTTKHIGSVGVDLFQDKVLIIDYPNTRIAVTEEVPPTMVESATFVDITLDRRGRAVLPLVVKNEVRKVTFDTGSSLFQLITTPPNWAEVTSGRVTDSILVTTFGAEYYMYGTELDSIYLGDERLSKAICYQNEYIANSLNYNGVWGMTGNAYFWDYKVIVDFASKQFGVIK